MNIWGGHVKEPLEELIKSNHDCDILCLQEVYRGGGEKINRDDRWVDTSFFDKTSDWLPKHKGYFCPLVANKYGLATFIKSDIKVQKTGEVPIFDNSDFSGVGADHSRKFQWLACVSKEGHIFTVINLHGLWNGKGKYDCSERIEQSQIVRNFIDSLNTPWLLVGDFNLTLGTKSLAMLDVGATNWVVEKGVQSTRTSFYPKEERLADYVVTSHEIIGSDFYVMPEEVSDHAALAFEFSIKSPE